MEPLTVSVAFLERGPVVSVTGIPPAMTATEWAAVVEIIRTSLGGQILGDLPAPEPGVKALRFVGSSVVPVLSLTREA